MDFIDTSMLIQYAGVIGPALVAAVFLLQKFYTSFKATSTESSIITLMHTELERMAEQNSKLSTEIGKLQEEMIRLNKQLRALTEENQKLHTQVVSLTNELARLQDILHKGGTNAK